MIDQRSCPVCGASLDGRRRGACRREANRVTHLLAGKGDTGYASLDDYAQRRRRRANDMGEE